MKPTLTDPDDFASILADLDDVHEDPVLPFRWEDLPHESVGPRGYRDRARKSVWSLALPSGRVIRLASIRQVGTHAGILCGSPRSDEHFNDRLVKNAIEHCARELRCEAGEIVVLQPMLLRSLETKRPEDPDPEEIAVDYLPPVRTLAVFESGPVGDRDADWSSVAVLWFQNAFGLPEAGQVVEQLRMLEWDALAKDCSW